MYPDIYEHQSFAYDTSGALLANTLYFIPEGSKSLVAVLNSNLIEFYYRYMTAQVRGGYMRAFSTYISQIPLASPPHTTEAELEHHVNAILSPQSGATAVAEHEQVINEIVYRLYDLTKEEIAIVEGRG